MIGDRSPRYHMIDDLDDAIIARFWRYVDKKGPDECWDWIGSRDSNGYGKLKVNNPRRHIYAHVTAYRLVKGSTGDLYVCHSCDRPCCCNPNHLWLGTNRDNQLDCVKKGRRGNDKDQRGEANGNAVLTAANVVEIRRMIEAGMYNTTIAKMFGVTHSMISRIRRGKAWSGVM